MNIIKADISHKDLILEIADKFSDFANSLDDDYDGSLSTFSRDNSGPMLAEVLDRNLCAIFLAIDEGKAAAIVEIHKVPRIRKARYYGEIELMFVDEEYRGSGIAKEIMNKALEWGKEEDLECLRLYSGHQLNRAHAFYEKMGFVHAGRTYKYSYK
ncbi:GNAT family N-acetyltransferase [Candidatus Dojkabacteria bacterium]|uniref:GNAT family N-acetyltransferase n=1 Tax=Candidatus Dojkabacteria bacterium TaxID=2099670 RepID=A0A955L4E2_9BACT|nr:GNAT family N-acetyltransferase [Candidatus Dojkabacteria bacterium]